jgi:hypothetical protein
MKKIIMIALVYILLSSVGCSWFGRQRYHHFTTETPLKDSNVLVIGILGGNEKWNDASRGIRQLALKLDKMNIPGVHVETLENRKLDLAVKLIVNAFDRNGDGQLNLLERTESRLILYGHSLGGAAVGKLSRRLMQKGLDVMLTVQVDSVGLEDHIIPSNVRKAANLYQRNGWLLKGENRFEPENFGETSVVANIEFDYSDREVDMTDVPWERRLFSVPHSKMDADPDVWALVEALILSEIDAQLEYFSAPKTMLEAKTYGICTFGKTC